MSRIGNMRESLALQSNAETTSTGTGFRTAAWTTYATVAGEYQQPTSGTEGNQQVAVVAQLGMTFRIRYRSDVFAKHRVLWRGQTLQILAPPIPVMKVGNRFLELQCGLAQ
jgi:SPP1 family predicted phage head-tail adaptor